MPELPEVETVVRDLLAADVVNRPITGARISWHRTVYNMSANKFQKRLIGSRILDVRRRAKYIVMPVSSRQWLMAHLRMSGRIEVASAGEPRLKHERLALVLDDGREIRFIDTRKFGRWYLVDDPESILGRLGPEPLSPEFSANELYLVLQRHKRMLKPLLLDQNVLAGLGNIYVDEALWEAKLHPCLISSLVSKHAAGRLFNAIQLVLGRGIRSMGTSLGKGQGNFYSVAGRRGRNQDGLRVFRRQGEPCPRCGSTIERQVVAQRSTHICPACQFSPK